MVSHRINVLVYSGHGSTIESVRHCLYSLRRLLLPNYAVIPVTETIILKEPWTASCALLVFPGGADSGYCRSLNGDGNRRIEQYVRQGGAYLGFCAGGYYGSSRCEFEIGDTFMEVAGPRELSFFPGICRGCAFKGFKYHSEAGAKAVSLEVFKKAFKGDAPENFRSYYNGGGVFVDAVKLGEKGVEILASYSDTLAIDGGDGSAAVVYRQVGEGGIILTGPHPEFSSFNLDPRLGGAEYRDMIKALAEDDAARIDFLKACLTKLGLFTCQGSSPPSLSQLHLSSIHQRLMPELLSSWKEIIIEEDGERYIKGEHDIFHLEKLSSACSLKPFVKLLTLETPAPGEEIPAEQMSNCQADNSMVDYDAVRKRLILHETEWPDVKETPCFSHQAFYAKLQEYQQEKHSESEEFGKYLMYGEVVTSTNTLLEKNITLLEHIPTGFTFTATTQVAGRGRGSNVWVSPAGSLIMSVFIKHPMTLTTRAPIVFVQYLAGIAIVEAIQSYDHGYDNIPVKLKWPNDIYPSKSGSGEYTKIGGILVNSSYSMSSAAYQLIVGIGLNTTNASPTTSLSALLPLHLPPIQNERLLARILTTLETTYRRFCRTGFNSALEARYYRYWLHDGQIVTLEDGARARVIGITRDGLLRVAELGSQDGMTGRIWVLNCDGNSFDFFRGLVRTKGT